MKVCVDRTRSALNKLQHKNTIELTNNDSSTSTGINNDGNSQDSENLKMPALLLSNENKPNGFKQHTKNMFNKFSSYWFTYIYIYI